jgi:von Willebrand factor type A domain/Aerotolerance regulator N-terminal
MILLIAMSWQEAWPPTWPDWSDWRGWLERSGVEPVLPDRLGEFSFAAPQLLWGLVLIPLALLAYVVAQRRRGRYAVRFTNLDLLAGLIERKPGPRRHLPPLLYLGSLALLVLALARPEAPVTVAREEATIVLVMDVSGSMEAQDVAPTRLAAAQAAANTFLDQVPERFRVGVVTFADTAQTILQPQQTTTSSAPPLPVSGPTVAPP